MPNWSHAPAHHFDTAGTYMVTASTFEKKGLFRDAARLSLLHDQLLDIAGEFGWRLLAWVVLPNHYHFIAGSPDDPETLSGVIGKLHAVAARELNRLDECPGRRVWYQYWDSEITFQRSLMARLKYVNENAVKRGVAAVSGNWPYGSAAWFERTAPEAFVRTVNSLKTDRVRVVDDFD